MRLTAYDFSVFEYRAFREEINEELEELNNKLKNMRVPEIGSDR